MILPAWTSRRATSCMLVIYALDLSDGECNFSRASSAWRLVLFTGNDPSHYAQTCHSCSNMTYEHQQMTLECHRG